MDFPKAIHWLLTVFIGLLSLPVDAQINLKTGYTISFMSDEGMNQVIHLFDLPDHTTPFKDLSWIHGFEAGFRYKTDVHGFELGYLGGYQKLEARGTRMPDLLEFTDKIKVGVHVAVVGYQVSGKIFGLGAELHHQWYRTRADIAGRSPAFEHTQTMLAYSIYSLITVAGENGIDLAIKPYIVIPDKPYDHDPLQRYNGSEILISKREKWIRYGISILFYNGEK